MSGFSAHWLALREPADRRARTIPVLSNVKRWAFAAAPDASPFRVVDLGAGTGASLRAVAPHLPTPQVWTLVDHDRDLLDRARTPSAPGLATAMIRRGEVEVRLHPADLARDACLAEALDDAAGQPCLITASALLDLVSEAWCRRLIRDAGRPGFAVYAMLTYDGRMAVSPAHPLDPHAVRLFNRHQRRDKGFGPALGPAAPGACATAARAAGARVWTGRSDWRLGPGQADLLRELIRGWGEAAQEAAADDAPDLRAPLAAWTTLRLQQAEAGRLRVIVGHRDLFAVW